MISTFIASTTPFEPMTRYPEQGDLLNWCLNMGLGTGILLMLVGAVYLMYGWSLHKGLVTLNAAALGGFAGAWIGDKAGYPLAACITGALVIALMTFPLRKWAIAIMGALCGIVVGVGVWRSVGLDAEMAWAGAAIGLISFGLASFILIRGSLIMYTSIQGSMMFIIGLLGLIMKYQDVTPKVTHNMLTQPLILPVAVLVPTILGLVFQQLHSPPAKEGGKNGGGGDNGH
jgi:hypothetical protein